MNSSKRTTDDGSQEIRELHGDGALIEGLLRARVAADTKGFRTNVLALINLLWDRGRYAKVIPLLQRLIEATPKGEEPALVALARLRLSVALETEVGLAEYVFAPGTPNIRQQLTTRQRRNLRQSIQILTEAVREWPRHDTLTCALIHHRLWYRQRALGLPLEPTSKPPRTKATRAI